MDSVAQNKSTTRRSWHSVFSPFSTSALRSLPDTSHRNRDRELRADRIPETNDVHAHETIIRDYQSTNNDANTSSAPISVRVPKKMATPIKVEGKVWFANERTWLSYLNVGMLIGTLALALFNASEDTIAQNFAYLYALISVGVLIYGWVIYQKRITMIRKRDAGHYDQIIGPIVISGFLFFAVLANFIIRVREVRRKNVPIPGET